MHTGLSRGTEVARLKYIQRFLEEGRASIEKGTELFKNTWYEPVSFMALERALNDVQAHIGYEIDVRAPLYDVIGVVTANNTRYCEGKTEKINYQPLSLEDAQIEVRKRRQIQTKRDGLEMWLYYIKEA